MCNEKMITDALRYMRVPPYAHDNEVVSIVKNTFLELENFIAARCVWGKFDISHFDGGFKIAGTDFYSRDLSRLTARSNQCFLIAATLGAEIDRQIILAQKKDMLKGIALDACASVRIDNFCDSFVKSEIENTLDLRIEPELRQRSRLTGELFLDLIDVIEIDMRITEGMNEFIWLIAADLSHHRQQ